MPCTCSPRRTMSNRACSRNEDKLWEMHYKMSTYWSTENSLLIFIFPVEHTFGTLAAHKHTKIQIFQKIPTDLSTEYFYRNIQKRVTNPWFYHFSFQKSANNLKCSKMTVLTLMLQCSKHSILDTVIVAEVSMNLVWIRICCSACLGSSK